jgi:hypothetical protein
MVSTGWLGATSVSVSACESAALDHNVAAKATESMCPRVQEGPRRREDDPPPVTTPANDGLGLIRAVSTFRRGWRRGRRFAFAVITS